MSLFIMTQCLGLFLAKAHRFHLRVFHAKDLKHLDNSISTLLTKCQVVFSTTLFVSVALNLDFYRRMRRQILAMHFKNALAFRFYRVLVKVEVDTFLMAQWVSGIQVGCNF